MLVNGNGQDAHFTKPMSIACFLIPAIGIACERARHAHLAEKPLVLSGDGGALQVVSEAAARYGLRRGQSASGARSLCTTLVMMPYDEEAYKEAARGIWDLLAIESSVVEPVSPELCFVEMDGRDEAPRVRALAHNIAQLVGVPIHAGLASSKLVARQAAFRAEPSGAMAGVLTVQRGRESDFLADLSLEQLPNLDRALLRRLDRLGIRTLGDVLRIKPHEMHRQCRQSGALLRRLAIGQDGDRVRAAWPPRALEETVCFETGVCEEALLFEAFKVCSERIARRLTSGRDYGRSILLEVSFEDGTEDRGEERLKEPVSRAEELIRAAERLLRRLRLERAALSVRLTVGGLGAGSGLQLILLDEHGNGLPRERRERLEATLSVLRKRYGEQAVVRASMLRPQRRIDLWTCALTRSVDEPVKVSVNAHGAPTEFWRRCPGGIRRYDVEAVQDRWKEADWFGGSVVDRTAYRIVAGAGLYELHRVGEEWRIGGIAD